MVIASDEGLLGWLVDGVRPETREAVSRAQATTGIYVWWGARTISNQRPTRYHRRKPQVDVAVSLAQAAGEIGGSGAGLESRAGRAAGEEGQRVRKG